MIRYASYWRRRPDQLGGEEVRSYQIWLRDELHVSSSYFNQAAGALRFFYTYVAEQPAAVERLLYARREKKLPVVLSVEELVKFLDTVPTLRYRAMLTTMYSAGLRLGETLHLRIDDIDSSRRVIRVRQGKGKKDRYVPLAEVALDLLRAYWRTEKPRGPFSQRARSGTADGHGQRGKGRSQDGAASRADQTRHASHPAPLVCHAPDGTRNEFTGRPGAARSCQRANDRDVYARLPAHPARRRRTDRSAALRVARSTLKASALSGVDLGAIVRAARTGYVAAHTVPANHRKVLGAIAACRTPLLGGQLQQCDRCGFEHIQWHSCRNRHCPRCQAAARAQWLEDRRAELLPVPYFHVVFTVPAEINVLARYAPRALYDILLRSTARALLEVGESKLHLELAALCMLHTWGQTLTLHPHVHCVVPGGGFAAGARQWRSVRKSSFFLPVKVLSRRFRTVFCNAVRQAWREGRMKIPERLLADGTALDVLLARAARREWVVYAKPPFGGPEPVLKYLASYTHRIAISNQRLIAFDGQRVTFRYRDYADDNTNKVITLAVDEFLRRFLQHVVPDRFVRIRYYGFLANRSRKERLECAREFLLATPLAPPANTSDLICPRCQIGSMRFIQNIDPRPFSADSSVPARIDSS
jgi:integrase